jgi:hypothetical protein
MVRDRTRNSLSVRPALCGGTVPSNGRVPGNSTDSVADGDRVAEGSGETETVTEGDRGADAGRERETVRDGDCEFDGFAEAETVAGRLAVIVSAGDRATVDVGL